MVVWWLGGRDWERENYQSDVDASFFCLSSSMGAHSAVFPPLVNCWLDMSIMMPASGTLVEFKHDVMDRPSLQKGQVEILDELETIFGNITLQEDSAKEVHDHAAKQQKRTVTDATMDKPAKKKQRHVWNKCANPFCNFTCSNYNQPNGCTVRSVVVCL